MIWALEVRLKEASDHQAVPPPGIDPIGASTDSTALLYKAIRDDIVSGRLTANQRLVVTDLAKRHGSSTTPVREVLQLLRGEGFVIFTRNRGARVRPIDRDFIRDIYEICVLIEPSLTRWFVGMATEADIAELEAVRAEVAAAGIDKPAFLAATQADEAPPGAIDGLAAAFPDLPVVPVSVLDEPSLVSFCDAVWALTGLIRVWLRKDGATDDEPLALDPDSTVADVADSIHHDLASSFSGARVWGPSARFEGQRVGRDHQVNDGDVIEIVV